MKSQGPMRERKLLQELQLRRTELELRNSELRRTERELLRALKRYGEIYDFAPVGYISIDRDGMILEANTAAAHLLETERARLKGQDFASHIAEDDRSGFADFIARIFSERGKGSIQVALTSGKEQATDVQIEALYCEPAEECLFALIDITDRIRIEKELRASQTRFRYFVENTPAAVAMFDRDMRYIIASRRWLTSYGLSDGQIVGRSHYEIFPELPQRWKDVHSRCLAGAYEHAEEDEFPRQDGTVDWVRWEVHPWYEIDGSIGGLIMFTEVVTAQKKAEKLLLENEYRLNKSQEMAHLGSWELDVRRGSLTWSDEVYRIFGIERNGFTATYEAFLDAVHPDDRAAVDEAYSASLRKGEDTYDIEHRIVRRNTGEIRYVREKCEHIRDKQSTVIRSIGMVHDVTERKRSEEEQKRAKEEAEAATRAKSQFLANMSHELRTPMNSFLGILQLLLGGHAGPLRRKQREMLEKADRSAHSLLQIISDILDLSRIEAGKLSIEEKPFSLRSCVTDATEFFFTDASSKGLDLSFSLADGLPDAVVGDYVRLRQVLINLVGNAVKFTQQGRVTVRVGSGRRFESGKREYTFAVADTGIGIPPEKQHLLFLPFSQIDPSDTRKHGGTGLGLAISRQIVEMMEGTISVESEEGRGTTFTFSISLKEAGKATSPERLLSQAADARRADRPICEAEHQVRILVAEDDVLAGELIREILTIQGFEMDLAFTGQEAVQMWEKDSYDLIIMDVQMPRMDGITATRIIREKEKGTARHIPIIAMTAHAFEEDRERCLAAGMDSYLTKPLDLAKGMSVIMDFLKGSRLPVAPAG